MIQQTSQPDHQSEGQLEMVRKGPRSAGGTWLHPVSRLVPSVVVAAGWLSESLYLGIVFRGSNPSFAAQRLNDLG